ncbi:MAG: hypothetical protein WCI67_22915 [Chloroflexales bacterium]
MIHPAPSMWDRYPPPTQRGADRPALTALALLAAANPHVAEQLMHDPLEAACAHPHYLVQLDDDDRLVLAGIRTHSGSVHEFLLLLADALDAAA